MNEGESVTCHGCLEAITPSEDNPTLICPSCQTENRPEIRIPYDHKGYEDLLQLLDQMSLYSEVADWDTRALKEQALIRNAYDGLCKEIVSVQQSIANTGAELEAARSEFEQQSIFKRAFHENQKEKVIAAELSAFDRQKANLKAEQDNLINTAKQLDSLIAYVSEYAPRSPEEKVLILKKIKIEKKELNAKKKEASLQMKAIRSEASNRSAYAGKRGFLGATGYFDDGNNSFGWYDPSLAAAQRRGIRQAKEEALAPLEDTKEEIEAKILNLDKRELFVEKFS